MSDRDEEIEDVEALLEHFYSAAELRNVRCVDETVQIEISFAAGAASVADLWGELSITAGIYAGTVETPSRFEKVVIDSIDPDEPEMTHRFVLLTEWVESWNDGRIEEVLLMNRLFETYHQIDPDGEVRHDVLDELSDEELRAAFIKS